MTKTLVAQLPPMSRADLQQFEREGGVWGKQREIRRKQLTVSGVVALAATGFGFTYMKSRRNTWLVIGMTLPLFTGFGAVAGQAIGVTSYPSVVSNQETTMMRRVWWAQQCSKSWSKSS